MKIVSWNVNGLRSTEQQFLKFIERDKPDILMLQELRAHPDQLNFFIKQIPGYKVHFNPAEKSGYSGTALYYKSNLGIESLSDRFNSKVLSAEGRTIEIRVNDLVVFNLYTPNGTRSEERLKYKFKYYEAILTHIQTLLNTGKSIIVGGDLNVAHNEKDLYAPEKNRNHSGFLPKEREWFDRLLQVGLVDTFRIFEKRGKFYTWWHMRDPKRKRNRGWRFDYFLVSKDLKGKVKDSQILKHVFGSDHCPIELTIAST